MKSYQNTSLERAAAYLKLSHCKVYCGMFTGRWACSIPFNRLIYVFEGSTVPSRISYGGKAFDMQADRWLFVPAGVRTFHEQHKGLQLISLHFNLELVTGIEYMQESPGFYEGYAPERRQEFLSLMERGAGITDVFMLQKVIWDLIQPIAEKEREYLIHHADRVTAFQPLFDAISQRPYHDFPVEEMAKTMKMGKEAFVKYFTGRMGVSPKLFFHRMRAAAAAKELLATEDTIREIAERFHFSDEFYFSRFMKRMTGLSPREYRRQMSFMQP